MSGTDWGRFADKFQLALENSEQGDPQSGTSGLEVEFNIVDHELRPVAQVGYGPEGRSFSDYLNEEGLPEGWNPLHVQFGYKREDSVITVALGWTYISCVGEVETDYPPQLLISDYMKALSGVGSAALLCADPLVAGILRDQEGFTSKEAIAEWLSKNTRIPVHQFWGNGLATSIFSNLARQGLEPYTTWQTLPPDSLI